jgi:N6-adenosine-specific RNA methylase IME4
VAGVKYRTIVADPPWAYEQSRIVTTSKTASTRPEASAQYPTMADADIAALPVAEWCEADAHLYLWATNPRLRSAFEIVEAWGFEYRTLLTWEKQGTLGMGYYFRGQTEHVLFATRGKLPIEPSKRARNIFSAPKTGHSVKPDAFMDLVERVSPGPYLEMFSRRSRFGWDTWGNEALDHLGLAS